MIPLKRDLELAQGITLPVRGMDGFKSPPKDGTLKQSLSHIKDCRGRIDTQERDPTGNHGIEAGAFGLESSMLTTWPLNFKVISIIYYTRFKSYQPFC